MIGNGSVFLSIVRFELKYQLRRPVFCISLAALVGLALVQAMAAAEMGGIAATKINGAHLVATMMGVQLLVGGFIIAIVFGDTQVRDDAANMAEIVGATPVPAWLDLLGRFVGSGIATTLIFLIGAAAYEASCHGWWIDQAVIGTFQPWAYGAIIGGLTLPSILILGALFTAVGALSRSLLAILLTALAVIIFYLGSNILRFALPYEQLASLIDPTGYRAFQQMTKYWTIAERESRQIALEGVLLQNRLLWLGIGSAMLLAVASRTVIRLRVPVIRRRTAAAGHAGSIRGSISEADRPIPRLLPRPAPATTPITAYAGSGLGGQIKTRVAFEFRRLIFSWTWLIMLGLFALLHALMLSIDSSDGSPPILPVTASIVPKLAAACGVASLLMALIFGGETVWREQRCGIAEILDATPTPAIVYIGAKLAAITGLILLLLGMSTAIGIYVQLTRAAPSIELAFYGFNLFATLGPTLLMYAVLATFVHVLVGNRYVGHLLSIVMVALVASLEFLNIDQPLLRFAEIPETPLSDMNGFGHHRAVALWMLAYWAVVTVLLGLAAHLLWPRGPASTLRGRLRDAHSKFTGPARLIGITALSFVVIIGVSLQWNTRVLNFYLSKSDTEKRLVAFETANGPFQTLIQPQITDIDMSVDLDPERRAYVSRGRYTLFNQSNEPISEIHVGLGDDLDVDTLAFGNAVVTRKLDCCQDYVIRPRTAMMPGESRDLTFGLSVTPRGWVQSGEGRGIRHNGTFLYQRDMAPTIGIDRSEFLQDERRRSAFGLQPLDEFPVAGDLSRYRRNYVSATGFTRFAITVSTSPDQTAVAPGYLKREWQEGGRRFFRYEADEPVLNFWSLLSARYAKLEDKWNDVQLSVYYHPGHDLHVERMLGAMKIALDYCAKAFGPYQHRQLRILEFPYGNFAQAFANTVPFAEMGGFISEPAPLAGFDHISFVTAHETAHQWFAHQIVSADVPGATFLSETLAEYAALMVMQKNFGRDRLRGALKRNLDKYLESRGKSDRERPLVHVAATQPHIAYQKGGHAMYALQHAIGEAAVNRAIAKLVARFKFKSDPYPTSADLIAALRAEAGAQYQGLITDLFEKIVLWDFGVARAATAKTSDGQWRTVVNLTTRKVEATELGVETAVALDEEVEVGLYSVDPRAGGGGGAHILKQQRHRVKVGETAVTFITPTRPTHAGVNAELILLQRDSTKTVAAVVSD